MSPTTRTAFFSAAAIAVSVTAALANTPTPVEVSTEAVSSWDMFETIVSTFDANTKSGLIFQNAKLAS